MQKEPLKRFLWLLAASSAALACLEGKAFAVHLADGVLPFGQALAWNGVGIAAVAFSLKRVSAAHGQEPFVKAIAALMGAVLFVLSGLPIPVPFLGTTSHPTGMGIVSLLVGPYIAILVTLVALVLQALLLGHGGISTLGANLVSMGVVGSLAALSSFRLVRGLGGSKMAGAFVAGLLGDYLPYFATATILAFGVHGTAAFGSVFLAILAAYAPTQVPIGILDGVLALGAYRFLTARRPDVFEHLKDRGLLPRYVR